MLHYVYRGQDLNNMIYAANKYDLPGLKDLLFFKMKTQKKFITYLLILGLKYQAGKLKKPVASLSISLPLCINLIVVQIPINL